MIKYERGAKCGCCTEKLVFINLDSAKAAFENARNSDSCSTVACNGFTLAYGRVVDDEGGFLDDVYLDFDADCFENIED